MFLLHRTIQHVRICHSTFTFHTEYNKGTLPIKPSQYLALFVTTLVGVVAISWSSELQAQSTSAVCYARCTSNPNITQSLKKAMQIRCSEICSATRFQSPVLRIQQPTWSPDPIPPPPSPLSTPAPQPQRQNSGSGNRGSYNACYKACLVNLRPQQLDPQTMHLICARTCDKPPPPPPPPPNDFDACYKRCAVRERLKGVPPNVFFRTCSIECDKPPSGNSGGDSGGDNDDGGQSGNTGGDRGQPIIRIPSGGNCISNCSAAGNALKRGSKEAVLWYCKAQCRENPDYRVPGTKAPPKPDDDETQEPPDFIRSTKGSDNDDGPYLGPPLCPGDPRCSPINPFCSSDEDCTNLGLRYDPCSTGVCLAQAPSDTFRRCAPRGHPALQFACKAWQREHCHTGDGDAYCDRPEDHETLCACEPGEPWALCNEGYVCADDCNGCTPGPRPENGCRTPADCAPGPDVCTPGAPCDKRGNPDAYWGQCGPPVTDSICKGIYFCHEESATCRTAGSFCGNGVLDADMGEVCDRNDGCDAGELCASNCQQCNPRYPPCDPGYSCQTAFNCHFAGGQTLNYCDAGSPMFCCNPNPTGPRCLQTILKEVVSAGQTKYIISVPSGNSVDMNPFAKLTIGESPGDEFIILCIRPSRSTDQSCISGPISDDDRVMVWLLHPPLSQNYPVGSKVKPTCGPIYQCNGVNRTCLLPGTCSSWGQTIVTGMRCFGFNQVCCEQTPSGTSGGSGPKLKCGGSSRCVTPFACNSPNTIDDSKSCKSRSLICCKPGSSRIVNPPPPSPIGVGKKTLTGQQTLPQSCTSQEGLNSSFFCRGCIFAACAIPRVDAARARKACWVTCQ